MEAAGDYPEILQKLELKTFTNQFCEQKYKMNNVHQGHICAFSRRGQGACNVMIKKNFYFYCLNVI